MKDLYTKKSQENFYEASVRWNLKVGKGLQKLNFKNKTYLLLNKSYKKIYVWFLEWHTKIFLL